MMRASIVIAVLALAAVPAAADPIQVRARIVLCEVSGAQVTLTFDKGAADGVAAGWRGHLVFDRADAANERFTIIRVNTHVSIARVNYMIDGCKTAMAILEPPARKP